MSDHVITRFSLFSLIFEHFRDSETLTRVQTFESKVNGDINDQKWTRAMIWIHSVQRNLWQKFTTKKKTDLSQYLGLKDCKENRENPRDFDLKIFPSEQFASDMRRLKFVIDNEKVGAYELTETIIYYHLRSFTIIYYHLSMIYVLLLTLLDA